MFNSYPLRDKSYPAYGLLLRVTTDMPIETFPNNGSADKAGKWKERELQIFNPSPSESNLGRGKKKVKTLHQNTLLQWICLDNIEIVKKTLIY